jgi:hypothetical protein
VPILPIAETNIGFVQAPPRLELDGSGKIPEMLLQDLNRWMQGVTAALNGGLRLGPEGPALYEVSRPAGVPSLNGVRAGNLDAQIRQFYFDVAATVYEVPHGLGRKPIGIIVLQTTQYGATIHSTRMTEWTDQHIYLVANLNLVSATFIII